MEERKGIMVGKLKMYQRKIDDGLGDITYMVN